MNLQESLYEFCKDNNLEELSCIIQFTIVNYLSSHKSQSQYIYLSPKLLDAFLGIGEDKIIKLFEYLCEESDSSLVNKSYKIYCPEDKENKSFCDAIDLKEYNEGEEIEIHCSHCHGTHTISRIEDVKYDIDYEGDKQKILSKLKISTSNTAKEMTILNTSDKHLDLLANILLSRLSVEKQNESEAKKGLLKILGSVKAVTGLISEIGEDVANTSSSVKSIVENFTGLSTFKDLLK